MATLTREQVEAVRDGKLAVTEARQIALCDLAIQGLEIERLKAERDHQKKNKDEAYLERNKLVALLASLFPSGIKRTSIEGWSPEWHGCVYINFPWGQASWHYHDSQAHLFDRLPPYSGDWDGHTTAQKYEAIVLHTLDGLPAALPPPPEAK